MLDMKRSRGSDAGDSPASVWKERELLDGRLVDVGVVILRTRGCRHYHAGGCSMCGYNYGAEESPTQAEVRRQFEKGVSGLGDVRLLKVYTSGSFLDDEEVSPEVRKAIARWAGERGCRLLFETRPEFASLERMESLAAVHRDLEVALGLESANDRVLRCSVNKGLTVEDYDRAARAVKSLGLSLRTYVLLKPPFLTEAEAVADAKATIAFASRLSDTISLNPVNVQKGTLVERLWRTWSFRPPWLWSVLDVLRAGTASGRRVVCDPTGGGHERGAHNCGRCDATIMASIRAFSASQDRGRLGHPECDCVDIWRAVMELDGFVMGGTADLQRFFRKHRT